MPKTRFSEMIEARMREQNISQHELSRRANLSQSSINRFLSKTDEQLLSSKLSTFVELARATNVDLMLLLSTIVPADVIRSGGSREEVARAIGLLPEEKRQIVVELIRALAFGSGNVPNK